MRGSYNGNTLAFQAKAEGSIPLPRSRIQVNKCMGTEQLYFVIGFLLGTMLTGCLVIIAYAFWYEVLDKPKPEIEE